MNSSLLKKTYDGIALFAVLNLLVIGGLGAYLIGSGALNGPALKRVAAALREEEAEEGEGNEVPVAGEGQESAGEQMAAAAPQGAAAADGGPNLEIMRQEADRIKEELRQRLALNNGILLRITTERENFRKEREAAVREDQVDREQTEQVGFAKQVEILENLKPATAVEHLLAIGDSDEIARMLLEMETRKAKKIVEAAKQPDQMEQMKLALQRLREVAPSRSDELATGE